MNKIWYGQTSDGSVPDPAIDNGNSTSIAGNQRWYGYTRGTELTGTSSAGHLNTIGLHQVALSLQDPTIADPTFINATGNGQNRWMQLSYSQYSAAFDRGLALNSVFGNINTDSPDLSAFDAHSGKLLHYHGGSDFAIMPQGSVNYYNRVAATMGGFAAIQKFYRFFIVPGMGHGPLNGTSNPLANPPLPDPGPIYDVLTNWVENGVAPSQIVLTSQTATPVQKSAPVCLYPQKAHYVNGDANVAASYVCS